MLFPRTRQPHSPSSHADHRLFLLPMLSPLTPALSSTLTTSTTTSAPTSPHQPGPDPSSVDFRTFYPYTPNEVKHRKRTSRAQLKVLEAHFVRDTKPNATVRKVLADQLSMSVRGVQVWFQNRRAKEKSLAAKVLAARNKSSPQLGFHSPSASDPEHSSHHSHHDQSSTSLVVIPKPPVDSSYSPQSSSTAANTADFADTSSEPSPINTHPPSLLFSHPVSSAADSCPTPWQNSPSADQSVFIVRPGEPDPFDPHNAGVRRGSLPVSYGDFPLLVSDDMDAFPRRRSVDHSLLRLASHPYAPFAMAKNGELFGTSDRSSSPPRGASSTFPSHLSSDPASPYSYNRPRMTHSLSPVELSHPHHQLFNHPPPIITTTPAPLHHHHHFTSRIVSAPVPGPLPSPNYSFGAAPVGTSPSPQLPSPVDSDPADSFTYVYHNQGHPHAPRARQRQTRPRYLGDDADAEDDGSYREYHRFGSTVSLACSESSSNSAYFSEVSAGSGVASDIHTRSSPNGGFLNLMSGLNMNRSTVSLSETHPNVATGSAGHELDLEHNHQNNDVDNGDAAPASPYSSPSPTISPCQPLRDESNPSSALVFALQHQRHHHPAAAQMGDSTTINVNDGSQAQQHSVPFYYESAAGDNGANSGSNLIGYNMSVLSTGSHYHHQHHPGTTADVYAAAYGTATVNPSFLG